MGSCPDCRYCEPATSAQPRQGWPHPARWFDQPCAHCSHRLKAHHPGVPRELTSLSASFVMSEDVSAGTDR